MIETRWLVAGRIFCVTIRGALTLDLLQAALDQFRAVLNGVTDKPVHCVLDLTPATRNDEILHDVKLAVDVLRKMQPALPLAGWTVIADPLPNQIVKSIGATATQVIRVRTRFITSVEEGVAFLRQIDETLPQV
jgi:hypothetical protein